MTDDPNYVTLYSPGDLALWKLCKLLVEAAEWRPEPGGDTGVLFEHTANRYFERIAARERHSAEWFYRNKTSFDTKFGEDGGRNGEDPAWTSDCGQGAETSVGIVSHALHGDENAEDDATKPSGVSSDWKRRRKSALERVRRRLPHAAETLKLIIKNRDNRKESICSLVKSQLSSRKNGNSRGKSTTATSATSPGSSPASR